MSKRFNTLETMRILLNHPQVMLDCIQGMDDRKERYIRESALIIGVRNYIAPLEQDTQRRLKAVFKTENLFQSQVVADIEKKDGEKLLLFQDEVLNIFRLCNVSLQQDITDTKLRSRLDSLRSVGTRLEGSSFLMSDPDFTELRDDLLEQLSSLLGLVRKNVAAMQYWSSKLEALSAQSSKSPEYFLSFRQELFEKITLIYDRHIKPTWLFVNPNLRLAEGLNLFSILSECKQRFETYGFHEVADQIFRFSMSFTNIYKPVTAVSKEVERFLRKSRNGMLESNAMEHFYQQLRADYGQTLSHDLRKTRLERTLVKETGFALGLKQQVRPKNYRFGHSIAYTDNLFTEIELRLGDLSKNLNWLPEAGESASVSLAKQSLQRAEKLYQWMKEMELRPTQDLIAMLHYRLLDFLPNYQFSDLLTASIRLSHEFAGNDRSTMCLVNTNKHARIEFEQQSYVYRRRRLEAVKIDTAEK
jgi:hypothetical protein